MNKGLQRILSAIFAVIAIYFLVWPFLNGLMSHRYYFKAISEGWPNSVYISEFGKDQPLSVRVEHYNNVSTQEEGYDATEHETTISDEVLEKLVKVSNYYRGNHLIFRQQPGYAMFYDANASSTSVFIDTGVQKEIVEFSKILEDMSRGDEKIDRRTTKTYRQQAEENLNKFMDKHGIV